MKELEMKKMLLATLALTVLVASPALAQTRQTEQGVWAASKAWNGQDYAPAPGADGAFGAYAQEPGAYAQTPSPDAGLGGDYVGTDPDPNVQLELLKDAQSRE
jgi:hypothetical protein